MKSNNKEYQSIYDLARTNYDESMSHVIAIYHVGEPMSRLAAALTLASYGYKRADVELNKLHIPIV